MPLSEDETRQEMTPTQSHEEIQASLRAEIDDLRASLEERFREIAILTTKLEEDLHQSEAQRQRHGLQISLLHTYYATQRGKPVKGVPRFKDQVKALRDSPFFDATWYLQTYPDVAGGKLSPEDHYVRAGAFEGRNPGPGFDTMAYYLTNRDVAEAGWPALVHYVMCGQAEGRAAG